METTEKFIEDNSLFRKGEKIGIGCSGGSDSTALLHFLATRKQIYGIEPIVIHVNHKIRENSDQDCEFVREFAKSLNVRFYSFSVDVPQLASEKGQSIETAAREARYNIFKMLKEKGVVDKIALAHHKEDQAETILMHIFRGCGVAGARGMEKQNDFYIRPFLETSKEDILKYLRDNNLSYLNDYTNDDISYNRNFVRNVLLKGIKERWPGAVDAIVNFGKAAADDDDYINSQIFDDAVIVEEKLIKIPTTYFLYSQSIVSRLIFRAFRQLGINKDIERRHVELITKLALKGENGRKINLPFKTCAVKEYDYVTIHNLKKEEQKLVEMFGSGETTVGGFGKICVKKCKGNKLAEGELTIDADKLPKNVVWRFRQEGDMFTKFGGGTKKLKSYFIDKKIPARERANLPLLASGNEIYVIAGVEISDLVKVDENTKNVYRIRVKK